SAHVAPQHYPTELPRLVACRGVQLFFGEVAVAVGSREVGAQDSGVAYIDVLKSASAHRSIGKVGTAEVDSGSAWPGEVGPRQIGCLKIGSLHTARKLGIDKSCTAEIGRIEMGFGPANPREILAAKIDPLKAGVLHSRVGKLA